MAWLEKKALDPARRRKIAAAADRVVRLRDATEHFMSFMFDTFDTIALVYPKWPRTVNS